MAVFKYTGLKYSVATYNSKLLFPVVYKSETFTAVHLRYIRTRCGKSYISDEQARKASISSEDPLVYENNNAETLSPQSKGEPKLQDSVPPNKITTV